MRNQNTIGIYIVQICMQKISVWTWKSIELPGYTTDQQLHAAGLFGVNQEQVLYAQNLHNKLYPASTTKVLTAYVALNMEICQIL